MEMDGTDASKIFLGRGPVGVPAAQDRERAKTAAA
jgi:hypothetical protein